MKKIARSLILVLALLALTVAPAFAQTTHTLAVQVYYDADRDGQKDSNEGVPFGLQVSANVVDYDCNGTDDGNAFGTMGTTGRVVLATVATNRSVCVKNIKFINPEDEDCWSLSTGNYRKYINLSLGANNPSITVIQGEVIVMFLPAGVTCQGLGT